MRKTLSFKLGMSFDGLKGSDLILPDCLNVALARGTVRCERESESMAGTCFKCSGRRSTLEDDGQLGQRNRETRGACSLMSDA